MTQAVSDPFGFVAAINTKKIKSLSKLELKAAGKALSGIKTGKGWVSESARHALAAKKIKTGRKVKIKKANKKMWVGDLGDVVISANPKAVTVYYVREEDGTKSWQLLPDPNSDVILKSAKVMPLDPEVLKNIESGE